MTRTAIDVEDVTYPTAAGDVSAWLVQPADVRPGTSLAGLVMWHWLDTEAPDGNRDEFLDEARGLAERGAVCVLPQGRFPWSIDPSGSQHDAAQVRDEIVRLRHGVDLLVGRREVDPTRIALVGHDFGAMYAIIAAAEDERVAALALIAPTPRWGDWFLPFWAIDEDRIAYLAAMRPLDPIERMADIGRRPVLLQLAKRDFFIPLMAGFELRRAAGEGVVELKAYDAEHDVRAPEARTDRTAFLAHVLRLRPEA